MGERYVLYLRLRICILNLLKDYIELRQDIRSFYNRIERILSIVINQHDCMDPWIEEWLEKVEYEDEDDEDNQIKDEDIDSIRAVFLKLTSLVIELKVEQSKIVTCLQTSPTIRIIFREAS